MAWSSETMSYCGWNERHVRNAKGKTEVRYYLERRDGCADLAVVGRLKGSSSSKRMYTLPTRDQLLLRLNETDQSVEKNMRRYMEASRPIIEYIDKLYTDRNIKLDW
ncbi:hypothetical protein Bca52824_015837 [Brassica carinata]|uniref:Uncharacterized protein n=1 Tax=Brassica carinata TaxID=52824 RepID=A0A8X7W3Y2_BRACI|nr:hypothetical protein Bca52824_015837 [Brassica carinata]